MSRPDSRRTPSSFGAGTQSRPLEDKLAIVTGASRGIGAAICENLASKGASLVMNFTSDSSAEQTEKLAKQLENDYGIKTAIVQSDIGDGERGPAHIVEIAKNHFAHPRTGEFQIDIIVNNAGISVNKIIEEVTVEDFTSHYNINVQGPLFLIKAALPYLPKDRSGRIVNLSSVSSRLGLISQSVYGGTKAALEAMTRTWARELSERATVNAVNPGPVATDMFGATSPEFQASVAHLVKNTPLMKPREGDSEEVLKAVDAIGGRMAYPQEIAGLVGLLCSPEAGWCTGSVMSANGGAVTTA